MDTISGDYSSINPTIDSTIESDLSADDVTSGKTKASVFSNRSVSVPIELTTEDVKHKILTEKAKFHVRPHMKTVARDYIMMIREENELKNDPEWDSYQQCLMKDIIHSRKINKSAEELLKKKRSEQSVIRIETDKKIKEMEVDERMFSASFVYFDKFVKENLEKRERAIENIKNEQAIRTELQEQILKADMKIKRLTSVLNDVAKCINDRKIFVDFLEGVRHLAPNQFRNGVHEIAERHEVLTAVRDELAKEQADALEKMQDLILEMFKMSDEHTEEIINLRTKLSELYCRHDTAKYDALYWESIVNKIEGMTAKEKLKQSTIKSACYYLYKLICSDRNITPTASKNNLREQLSFIEESIIMLRRALYILKKKKVNGKMLTIY